MNSTQNSWLGKLPQKPKLTMVAQRVNTIYCLKRVYSRVYFRSIKIDAVLRKYIHHKLIIADFSWLALC